MRAYWHFCKIDNAGEPVMRDGTLVEVGKRYEIEGELKLCMRGYHGSEKAIDALGYAPGPWVSKRPLEGVIAGDDKAVGRAFVQQPGIDATEILRDFARMCALDVIHLWDAPKIVVRYLEGGDESMRAAARRATLDAAGKAVCYPPWLATRAAARAAAWEAAGAATGAATLAAKGAATGASALETALEAAWDAARNAAWAQAEAAARTTSQDAVWDTARKVACDAQNRRLTRMLNHALKGAA